MNTEPIFSFRELNKLARQCNPKNGPTIRIAILGNHTTTFFIKALVNQLKVSGFDANVYEADYDQIDLNIIDDKSDLYRHDPEIIIIFESTFKLRDHFYNLKENHLRSNYSVDIEKQYVNRMAALDNNCPNAKVVCFSYELFDDQIYGNLFSKVDEGFYNQLWKINSSLLELSRNTPNFYVFEINKYLNTMNVHRDWAGMINSDLHYTIDTFTIFAHYLTSFLKALKGVFKKCLILDLDNTMWGGIIGDDGIDNIQIGSLGIGKAFTLVQKWAKSLKERGVILAVCSKNTEGIAKEPFEKHEEMVLRLDDISVFVANWKNKADNIRYIQEVLNIGFDSMVFIDDNPAERDIVRQSIPEVTVPELPEDPADYFSFLSKANLFDTASYSVNDKDRTLQYQQEARRRKMKTATTNMADYLKSLEMEGEIAPFSESDVPRIAQLTQRSNQFNLRTKRYTDGDIIAFMESSNFVTYSVKLKDRFGDYGLISVIILEKVNDKTLFVDTWIMSCRVLKRDVEHFAINHIVQRAIEDNIFEIHGEYIETAKNGLVSDLLTKLTFCDENGKNILATRNFKNLENHIS